MPITISTSSAFFRWRPACWLRIAGEDAANFLQGQFTNDLRSLGPNDSSYGLWLTVKGKVLADSFVLSGKSAGEFWVGSYFSSADVIRSRLESYVIADDVLIEDETDGWGAVSVLGGNTEALKITSQLEGCVVFSGRRDHRGGIECAYKISKGEPVDLARMMALARELNGDEMVRRRIVAGIPAIPVDVGSGDLPNEAGLERDAISYTKGCYLGQEVMARLKAMGQVRRRLRRVCGSGQGMPATPAPLFAGERQIGDVRSAVDDGAGGWIGLAMISLLALGDHTELSLAPGMAPSVRLLDGP